VDLTDAQQDAIIAWAKKTLELRAVFLYGSRAKGTAKTNSGVDLALSMIGPEPGWRLANFISNRRD
jgi:predicted nucleotidyltransferase